MLLLDLIVFRTICSMEKNKGQTFKSILDIIVLGGIIGVVNWLVSRGDFGWLGLNPTPWLLVPVMIGARYGAVQGLLTGVLSSGLIAIINAKGNMDDTQDFLREHPFFFSSLVLMGYLCGEVRRRMKGRHLELYDTCRDQKDTLNRLNAELELTREARQELQEHLALHNVTMSGLDDDLRKLVMGPQDGLMDGLLGLLHQHADVTSAALYRRSGGHLERVAVMHPTAPLKEKLSLDEVPLARRALEDRSVVSVKVPTETNADQPFLAALPYEDHGQEGLLLVQDMPLKSFNWSRLARIELMLLWTFAMQHLRKEFGEAGTLVPLEAWKVLLSQALVTEQMHHIPSIVMKIKPDAENEKALLKSLAATAAATKLPGTGELVVLLPMGGEMEAGALMAEWQRLGVKQHAVKYPVLGKANVEEFWKHLVQP